MARRQIDMTNSHYLNEKNRIIPVDEVDEWQIMDADSNIRTGNTFGEDEAKTIEKQGWKDSE